MPCEVSVIFAVLPFLLPLARAKTNKKNCILRKRNSLITASVLSVMDSKYLYTIWAPKLREPPDFPKLKTFKGRRTEVPLESHNWRDQGAAGTETDGCKSRVRKPFSWCGNGGGKARLSLKNEANRDSKFL